MNDLRPRDFVAFFKAVYGYEPFPWQVRLAEQVTAENGHWPHVISVPTASGKTACLDVAVFAMALQADWPDTKIRTAPRRIFFVVDRRVIVEEAYVRARDLAKRLRHTKSHDGIVGEVAERLRRLAVGRAPLPVENGSSKSAQPAGDVPTWLSKQPPLACYQMRGGIYRDHAWARTPTQPTIITSTVDQVGSRLLYRGYGVSEFSRPLHAGLTANDSLIILDEAHCSNPFSQTMQAVKAYRGWHDTGASQVAPFHFVSLSATPSGNATDILKIEKEDEAHASHKELDRRIRASKLATLLVADKAKGKQWVKPLAVEIADQAVKLQAEIGSAAIGIIVNRVATAREVRNLLRARLGDKANVERKADVELMTGRMREVDRREFLATWQPLLAANPHAKEPRQLERPAFIVATQCLEVGANLDFDALVTECASLDALRQRFGRLNRLGQRAVAKAVIVIRGDQTEESDDPKKNDLIYGQALPRTWQWLKERSTDDAIDLGIASVNLLLPTDEGERNSKLISLQPEPDHAPTMLPAHLDALVQTSPTPWPDPDIALFLHGPQRSSPDIQVCWRADLVPTVNDGLVAGFTGELLKDTAGEFSRETAWVDAISYCPPTASECLTIPLFVFEKWLATGRVDDRQLADVEGIEVVESETDTQASLTRPFLRWCGPNDKRTVLLRDCTQLRPGDMVVLPTWLGGFDSLGDVVGLDGIDARNNPDRAAKADSGDSANVFARFKPVLRIHELLASHWPPCEAQQTLIALAKDATLADCLTTSDFAIEVSDALSDLANSAVLNDRHWTWLRVVAGALARQLRRRSSRPKLYFMSYGWTQSGEDQQLVQRNLAHKGGFVVSGSRLTANEANQLFDGDAGDEDYVSTADSFTHEDDSSSSGVANSVTLKDHTAGVVEFADHLTAASRLSPQLAADIRLAARLHDLGKSDPRFQAWLLGGNARAARMASEPLAKSGMSMDRTSNRLARERSGYPSGGRHELLSVRLVESATEWLSQAHDPDLVLHLIAAHHGCCRPFAPVIKDTTSGRLTEPFNLEQLATVIGMPISNTTSVAAEMVLPTKLEDVASGVAERFWLLVRRYGWWGLAWLETQLILADRCESQREQELETDRNESEPTT